MTRIPERFSLILVLALGAMLNLNGCAVTGGSSSTVKVDHAESGVPKCQTFDWLSPSKEAATFTEQRVRAAALEELKAKGYEQSTDKPDCRISYLLNVYERPKSKPSVGVGAGGGSGGIGGGIGVSLPIGKKNQQVGTFTLDVIDTAKNAQVWSGSLDGSFKSAELSEDEARAAVKKVLAEYPNRTTAN